MNGWVSTPIQPVIVPRYTVHERALYFNSTFFFFLDAKHGVRNMVIKEIKNLPHKIWFSKKKKTFSFTYIRPSHISNHPPPFFFLEVFLYHYRTLPLCLSCIDNSLKR